MTAHITSLTHALRLLLVSCAAILLASCSPAPDARPGKPAGGDFVLQGPKGAVDTKAFRGKLLLIYFGGQRHDLFIGEAARRLADHHGAFGEVEIEFRRCAHHEPS